MGGKMDLTFESGSPEHPKGHAFIYFTSSSDSNELWATYLMILPITVDVSKYVPPFLMNQVGDLGPKELTAFAFPPAPERVEGRDYIEGLAVSRDDDILYGGTLDPNDVASGMMFVTEAAQRYADAYTKGIGFSTPIEEPAEEETGQTSVNDVLYGLMSDGDKLGELTKLVGRLRFSSDGGEESLVREAEADIRLMAGHLPAGHQVPRLIEAVKGGGSRNAKLADLYLQRCFHLIHEEYVQLGRVEAEIRALETSESPE